jgi:hypothetical protein
VLQLDDIAYVRKVLAYAKFHQWTQVRLADAAGYSEASIRNWAGGRHRITLRAFLDLAQTAELSLWLIPKRPGPEHIVRYLQPPG